MCASSQSPLYRDWIPIGIGAKKKIWMDYLVVVHIVGISGASTIFNNIVPKDTFLCESSLSVPKFAQDWSHPNVRTENPGYGLDDSSRALLQSHGEILFVLMYSASRRLFLGCYLSVYFILLVADSMCDTLVHWQG